jgi:hypothetical protein
MVCKKGTISGSLIQKIWWWLSRKEVKLKFFVEMDETEMDDFFGEAVGWDSSVFTGEGVGSTKSKPKKSNKQGKVGGKQEGKTVRKAAKKDSGKSKRV